MVQTKEFQVSVLVQLRRYVRISVENFDVGYEDHAYGPVELVFTGYAPPLIGQSVVFRGCDRIFKVLDVVVGFGVGLGLIVSPAIVPAIDPRDAHDIQDRDSARILEIIARISGQRHISEYQ